MLKLREDKGLQQRDRSDPDLIKEQTDMADLREAASSCWSIDT